MKPDPPVLKVRRVELRKWLFLGYEGKEFARFEERWWIETREGQEGFWLVCGFPWTFVSNQALDMLSAELALVGPAMDEIRRQHGAPASRAPGEAGEAP